MDFAFLLDIPLWSVIVFIVLTTLYLYFTWNFGFLEKQGVKTKKPWPIIGSLDPRMNKLIMDLDMELYKKYGRIYGFYEGRRPVLHIADPELIKQITVKDFWAFPIARPFPVSEKDVISNSFLTQLQGEEWKRMRSVISPTFTTGKLKQMSVLIEGCSRTLVENLKSVTETGEPVDIKKWMSAFGLDVMAICAFGTKIDCISNPDSPFIQHAREISIFKITPVFVLFFFFPSLAKRLFSFSLLPKKSKEFFKNVVERVIEMREDEKYPRDFLALLLEAEKKQNEEDDEKTQTGNKKGISTDWLIAQAILFLIAGHESTANPLSFAFHTFAVNEEVQEKAAADVHQVMAKHDGKINYESVAEMTYVDMVVSETLRMYPPAIRTERTCEEEDYEVAGIKLQKGMIVGFPVYCIHHDPENYPDPEKFIPERFSAENKAVRDPFTYLPFGSGPRNCVAMRFALLKVKMAIAFVLSEFKVKKCPQTVMKPEFLPGRPFLQAKTLMIALEKRQRK